MPARHGGLVSNALDACGAGGYIDHMKVAGIRELKNKLSQYLRDVAKGEVVLVSDRGEVVAQLAPPPLTAIGIDDRMAHAIARLMQAGRLRPSTSNAQLSSTRRSLPRLSGRIDLAALLAETRADR